MTNSTRTSQMTDYQRTLLKWLNEEQTGPIDRIALAHVLGASLAPKRTAKPEPQPVIAPTNAEGVLMPKVPIDKILEAIVKECEFQEPDWMWNPKNMYQRILDAARKGIAPEQPTRFYGGCERTVVEPCASVDCYMPDRPWFSTREDERAQSRRMTTDNTQAMKQALEALENSDFDFDKRQAACAALINALSMTTQAQLVIAPEWVMLTDDEIGTVYTDGKAYIYGSPMPELTVFAHEVITAFIAKQGVQP